MTNEEVIKKYENLVWKVARSRKKPNMLEDLVQEGFIALCNANKLYVAGKHKRGKKPANFMTYARVAIINSMKNYILSYEHTINRPTDLYDKSKERSQQYKDNIEVVTRITSLDDAYSLSTHDKIEKDLESAGELKHMLTYINTLDKRIQKVLTMEFNLDGKGYKSRREIAEEMGFSQERARQMIEKGLRQLRHMLTDEKTNKTLREVKCD